MDLKLLDSPPTTAERDAVDGVLGPPGSAWVGGERGADGHSARGGHAARAQRHLLLPVLHEVQSRIGWISPAALGYVCRRLTIPPAEAYGVASFYALFALEPRAPLVTHVCTDIACMCRGGTELVAELERTVGPAGEHPGNGRSIWIESPCLGLCERAPAVLVTSAGENAHEHEVAPATAAGVAAALSGADAPETPPPLVPQAGDPSLRLLRRIGRVDPASLDSYRAAGGYAALRAAIDMGPAGVIREVTDSRLLGRGGAAFPTGRKWDAVARNPVRPHYLVCNADESEPGTFKDRVVIENDPFALVEAMTICGLCDRLRGGLRLPPRRIPAGVGAALGRRRRGAGARPARRRRDGRGRALRHRAAKGRRRLHLRRGDGPLQLDRGLPRRAALEAAVPGRLRPLLQAHGREQRREPDQRARHRDRGRRGVRGIGTEQSTGTRLFCLSGCVARPGLYEAPFGVTLGELLETAGGVAGGRPLKAVLLGGAAGGFVGPDRLDLELSFEATRASGTTLGSGVVMVFDDTVDLVPVLLRIAAFFRDESCGQCVPCRVGTVRQQEALLRLASKRPRGTVADELALLDEIAQAMRDASICGLGQTAANAIDSAVRDLRVFQEEPVA